METHAPRSKLGLLVRLGLFIFLAIAGIWLFSLAMVPLGGYVVGAVLGVFAAAAVANAITLRVYERGKLSDIGLGWTNASRRNAILGVAGGAGAALIVLGPPLLLQWAHLQPVSGPTGWPAILFLGIVLLFGAFGEEMLFRGYGFQILLPHAGPFATIFPTSVLFALAHSANIDATELDMANTILSFGNTFAWGVILGVAFLRSGDLWFPIGLHYGWNVMLPLFGVSLSGLKMEVTGYALAWKIGSIWSGGAYGPEGGLLTSSVLLLLAVYLWKAPIQGQEAFLLRRGREG